MKIIIAHKDVVEKNYMDLRNCPLANKVREVLGTTYSSAGSDKLYAGEINPDEENCPNNYTISPKFGYDSFTKLQNPKAIPFEAELSPIL